MLLVKQDAAAWDTLAVLALLRELAVHSTLAAVRVAGVFDAQPSPYTAAVQRTFAAAHRTVSAMPVAPAAVAAGTRSRGEPVASSTSSAVYVWAAMCELIDTTVTQAPQCTPSEWCACAPLGQQGGARR